MKETDIIFIRVVDNKSKLWQLTHAIQRHFLLHQRILIAVTDAGSAAYVDELLWRMPEESILPHRISTAQCQDMIVITTSLDNINSAVVLFSLRQEPHPHYDQFETLYELYDETHPAKKDLSQKRLESYPRSRFLPQNYEQTIFYKESV